MSPAPDGRARPVTSPVAEALRQMANDLQAELAAGGRSPFTAAPETALATLRMAAVRLDAAEARERGFIPRRPGG